MNTIVEPEQLLLYPDGAPGSEDWEHKEQWSEISWSDHKVIRNVCQPTLSVYLPDPEIAQGTGIILCPGGAWHFLAFRPEGTDVARNLNAQGIAAFVLKYRLIQTGDDYMAEVEKNMSDTNRMNAKMAVLRPLILEDGQRAMRMVREQAAEWGLDTDRIGMMGYSAGGSVALNVALQHEVDSRPDFVSAIYTAGWDDVPVPDDDIPLFILCTADDDMASANSTKLYDLWRSAGHAVEMHIYSKGGHGFCLRKNNLPVDDWLTRFIDWLETSGFHKRIQ